MFLIHHAVVFCGERPAYNDIPTSSVAHWQRDYDTVLANPSGWCDFKVASLELASAFVEAWEAIRLLTKHYHRVTGSDTM